jgi:hypothetical protein
MELTYADAMRHGACRVCWINDHDRRELEDYVAAHGHLPRGVRRRYGISRWSWFRHKRGCRGKFPWYREDWERRKANGWYLRLYQWKPGFCPNPCGRPRGSRDKLRRRAPQGIAAMIRAERGERRQGLERQRQEAIWAAEETGGKWDYFGSGIRSFR